ncbi:hypothetical protein CP980_02845 [Streptomyces vinaceus]|uniref:Secreted protein n=1 Tax=Streptomyces vinaceus TaxID=1960 RepID=A0A5J6J9F9_STRVI|nr:hypothetical protein [Streptomyces vinaceus]QEV44148.1 hypothetical protein CP980_02845 [Streptomyces vinaceus]GHE28789.1 hypothetical protein GCM10017778_08990 [Streptomyces vinaceus]
MSTGTLIAIIVPVAIVLIALAVGLGMMARRRRLQDRFGPEYDRAVEQEGGRLAAERELRAREEHHAELDIKELPEDRRRAYAQDWSEVQERFVDRPEGSVTQADELVSRLMKERGYPTAAFDENVRDLSVSHADTLQHYRAAHSVKVRSTDGQATTEELRGAMVHYRALFDELLSDRGGR